MEKFLIAHDICGRMRVRLPYPVSFREADAIRWVLMRTEGVDDVKIMIRTADIVVFYHGDRERVIRALEGIDLSNQALIEKAPDSGLEISSRYWDKMVSAVAGRVLRWAFLPAGIRGVLALINSLPYIVKGVKALFSGKGLTVEVLDASALTAAIVTADFKTASSVSFLLKIGEILEEWTYKKSVSDLANSMALNVGKVWAVQPDGSSVETGIDEINVDDLIRVEVGSMIPLDGTVVTGEAMVNQAAMTGESVPVRKTAESTVYAGTVVEEGSLTIRVRTAMGETRYEKIIGMIEDSEKLKSEAQGRAENLADRLVPYTFAGALLTGLLTRNVTKAVSVLMVDYSCALKLSVPIAVLSGMREASSHHITVKGGKFLENIAKADTIIFDKTGTLTKATPTLKEVVVTDGRSETEMLRIAACLEEHFPHSMANAVVRGAEERGITHEEMHSKVEYIVAHGIASTIDGARVVIGSHHFVLEDEAIHVSERAQAILDSLSPYYSHLYLGINGKLTAVICIEDPLRAEVPDVVGMLKTAGVDKIVMMTGDSERTARAIAAKAGLSEYHAEVLPEDKARYVEAEKTLGRTVMMVGDGINDSPALSAADVGVAIAEGADIAREIADVTISEDDLYQLVVLKRLANRLMNRLTNNRRFIVGFNTAIIFGGVFGIFMPGLAAILHNSSTVGICLYNMTNVLKDDVA